LLAKRYRLAEKKSQLVRVIEAFQGKSGHWREIFNHIKIGRGKTYYTQVSNV
jgi:hypothetical protein